MFFLVKFLLPLALLLQSSNLQQIPIVKSPGIIITEETGQVLYEATAPIIYSFETPNWDSFLSLKDIFTCVNGSSFCKIFDEIITISQEIRSSVEPPSFHSFPEETKSSTWGLRCHFLGQHFSSLRVDSTIIIKYLGFLQSCSKGVMLQESLNSEYASKPSLTYFQDAETIFETDFLSLFLNSSIGEDPVVQNGIHLNFLTNLLSSGLSSFISQSIRWNSAISHCKSGHIPDTLIDPTAFHQSLQKLNETLVQNGWRSTISLESEFLPLYYKNQLADCTFSDNIFYVRVLIPLVKNDGRKWKHITANPIPYYYDDNWSEEGVYYTKMGSDHVPTSKTYFYEETSKRLFKSGQNCNKDQPGFCRLPEIWDQSLLVNNNDVSNCISDILEGRLDAELRCSGKIFQNIREIPHLPMILREGTDIFYFTGVPEMDLNVKCQELDGSESTKLFPFPQVQGTLRVRLPCSCFISIVENIEIVIEAEAPCYVSNDMLNVTLSSHQDFA